MSKIKILSLALAVSSSLILAAFADDTTAKSAASDPKSDDPKATATPAKPATTNAVKAAKASVTKQADVASTNATFGMVSATNDVCKSALDAHALADALKMVDQEGAFKGTVAKVYEPRGLAIVEFDEEYRTALTAIVRSTNFDKFPALTNLIGKKVLVTGKFTKYRDAAQMALDKPEQIKVVEEAK